MIENEFFKTDESEFPIIKITFVSNDPSEKQIQQLIDYQLDTLQRFKKKFAVVYIGTGLTYIDSTGRYMMSRFMKNNIDEIKKKIVCIGFCIDSTIGKIILSGIFILQKPNYDYIIHSDYKKVEAWAKDKLAEVDN